MQGFNWEKSVLDHATVSLNHVERGKEDEL